MVKTKNRHIFNTICLAGLTLALLVGSTPADAQSREGRWEFTIGTFYQSSTTLDFEGGSTADIDSDFGFVATTGYHFSEQLEAVFGFQYAGIGYNADVVQDDGGITGIKGTYDTWTFSANIVFNLIDGPVTPYVGAGIGWSWIDSNIPSGLPSTGCWWDPFWGYVCYSSYPTHSTSEFTYQATLGLRYEFNDMTFMRLGYTSQWMDIGNSNGTPRFDVVGLEVGWMF